MSLFSDKAKSTGLLRDTNSKKYCYKVMVMIRNLALHRDSCQYVVNKWTLNYFTHIRLQVLLLSKFCQKISVSSTPLYIKKTTKLLHEYNECSSQFIKKCASWPLQKVLMCWTLQHAQILPSKFCSYNTKAKSLNYFRLVRCRTCDKSRNCDQVVDISS